MLDFSDIMEALDDSPFEEIPVDVVTFVTSPEYLDLPPLSRIQYDIVEAMSQIFRVEELMRIMGANEGRKHFKKYTNNEIILKLGKGCHAPYTPIFNPLTGKWEPLAQHKQGDVATINGNSFSTEAFPEGYGEMVRVKTSLGFEEDVYVGHKYLWMKRNKFYKRKRDLNQGSFNEVSNIAVGDRIAVGINMSPSNPQSIPAAHAELLGYWLGDGSMPSTNNRTMSIDFNINEVESMAHYISLCSDIKDTPRKREYSNKNMVTFIHNAGGPAVALARQYGLHDVYSHTKVIPDEAWNSDNSTLALLVSRLWQTDGCVYNKDGHQTAEFVSVSKELACGMHRALLRLGVPSTIRSRTPKTNFDSARKAYYVTVSGQESFNAFHRVISLLDHKKTTLQNKSGRTYSRIDGNIYWDRVVSITPLSDGEFWTTSVPKEGHYIGNGLVSANSGKDHTSTIAVAYVVYKMLCLRDPAIYYGKYRNDAIDIINIAINADQAKNVFFDNFMRKIKASPWFAGRWSDKTNSVSFDKSITVYSGHSERESHEGLNIFMAILDEISGFALTSNSSSNEQAKTADNIYKAFKGTVTSRFPDFGKVVLLSFPRFKNDYISQAYDRVVLEKETVTRTHTFTLNEELGDAPGNKFDISWEEDHITKYIFDKVFALCRPTWEVNPIRKIDEFAQAFYVDETDALMRYACMPGNGKDTFFRSEEKIRKCLSRRNPVNEGRIFDVGFRPNPNFEYYGHVDLAQVADKCAVAISHIDRWVDVANFSDHRQRAPIVVTDLIAFWEPRKEGPVDFADVKNFIVSLRRMGFNLKLVSFDRWHSYDIQNELQSVGIPTETVSVGRPHYDDLAMLFYEERLIGPHNEVLIDELLNLRILEKNGKVDHPAKNSKDLSDALAGSVTNALRFAEPDLEDEIDIHTYDRVIKEARRDAIEPPKVVIPDDIQEYLRGVQLL